MPQSRELRGVVVPEVDDRAVRRQVERPLNRVMQSVASITPNLDLGGVTSGLSGLGSSGGGGTSRMGSNSVAVAQLDVLEDIRDVLRRQDGGGGGLLTGLSLGRLMGGGAGAVAGGLGGALFGGALIGTGLQRGGLRLSEQLGLTDSDVARDRRQIDMGGGFLDTFADGFGDTVLNLIDPLGIGETLYNTITPRLREAFETTTSALSTGLERATSVVSNLTLPAPIRNFEWPTLTVPDFSSVRLPPALRRLTDVLGGGGGTERRTLDLRDRASDQSLSFSERRAAQGALGNQVRRGESTTVSVESPTLNADIQINAENILDDLQRQLDRELGDLQRQVNNLEQLLSGRNINF